MQMTVDEFIEIVGHKFFTVCFEKRSDQSLRVLNGRLRVKKHLKGGDKAYTFNDKDLVSVYDVQAKGYRAIPMEGVKWIRAGGSEYNLAA